MPIATTTVAQIAAHLTLLGVQPGDALVVHSRLLSFGRIEGGAAAVYDALRTAVGPHGTLAFPTFSLQLTPSDVYDPAETPSHVMGALSEHARVQPGVTRTLCPMHGFAVVGAKALAVLSADPSVSMGGGSSFAAMEREDFALLLLGCSLHEGGTFVHHVEADVGVPYREWLSLPRRVRAGTGVRDVTVRYYGRRRDTGLETDLSRLEAAVDAAGIACRVAAGAGRSSRRIRLSELGTCTRRLLNEDSYALMRPHA